MVFGKNSLKCQFYQVFLRVGFIFTVNMDGIRLPGSVPASQNLARALLSNIVRTPTAELFGELLEQTVTHGGVRNERA